MQYDTLYDEFMNVFPDDADWLNSKSEELSVEPMDGMHVIFGMVVVPFVLKLLAEKNEKKLEKAFDFFEQMASSGDPSICEVLEFTVLEDIISRGKHTLDICKKYMADETLKSCLTLEQYM